MINKALKKIKINKLILDSFWSLSGNIIGKGFALISGILVARLLGKDVFGEYGIIRSTILTISIFSTFGLGYTATKFIADFKIKEPKKIKIFIKYSNQITLIFSSIIALILFVFADKISINLLNVSNLGGALRILSILIIFNAITSTQIGILAGFGKFKELAKINTYIGILTFVFSVGLTYFFNLEGALLALLIIQILNCIFNFFIVKKEIPKNIDYDAQDKYLFKKIIIFSTPIALQECTYSIASWLTSVLLIRLTNLGDFGMYSAAMQWNAIILFIPGILRNVVLSHLSTYSNDKMAHKNILRTTIKINFIATLLPCICIAVIAPYIEDSYGQTFKGLGGLISIAVFSTIFTCISNVYAQAFTSIDKNWLMFFLRLFRDCLFIFGFIVLIKFFNISGAKAVIYSNITFSFIFLLVMMITYNIYNHDKIN